MSSYSVGSADNYTNVKNGNVHDIFGADGSLMISPYDTNIGFNLIRIRPNLTTWAWANSSISPEMEALFKGSIVGLVTNDFSYSLNSSWEPMEYPKILDNYLNLNLKSDQFQYLQRIILHLNPWNQY